MSMHVSLPPTVAADGAYLIKAPRPSDALNGALRRAFATDNRDPEQFADLLHQLDKVAC